MHFCLPPPQIAVPLALQGALATRYLLVFVFPFFHDSDLMHIDIGPVEIVVFSQIVEKQNVCYGTCQFRSHIQ